MPRRALIGHTGFVGSNLRPALDRADFYNSSNIAEMTGEAYDEVICCGVSAVKWLAIKEPEQDWAGIASLKGVLETIQVRRFTLISTIDVYPEPDRELDESADLTGLPNHAYGRHRLALEQWVAGQFPEHLIVRLPALFGPGLKKNALFDLMHGNAVQNINPAATFQWYPVERLSTDLKVAVRANLQIVNLFPEPIAMRTIIQRLFPNAKVGPAIEPAPAYRLRTRHAALFGGCGGHVMSRDAVMAAMTDYVGSGKRAALDR